MPRALAKPRFKQISLEQSAYLQLLIVDENPDSRKHALETICKLYRSGFRFRNPAAFLPHVVFLCDDPHDKVRRWAYNTLALIGTKAQLPAIAQALQTEVANPDILAAVIVALSALGDEDQTRSLLAKTDHPLEGFALLAAAQQNDAFRHELARTRIDIEKADVAELRLATLLLGLRKAPEHMLSERYPNSDVVGTLNFHPDELVSQYSVWATYEDASMDLHSLRILPKDFGDYHPGIRKYGYRLMVASSEIAKENREYIEEAATDNDPEAREGLAAGLRTTYFDSATEIVLPWFRDESSGPVRDRIIEHMAAFAERQDKYKSPVLVTYEALSKGSLGRARIEAAAAGTEIYYELKRAELSAGSSDLFDSRMHKGSANLSETELDAQSAKVLIVTALPKEAAAVLSTFDNYSKVGVLGDPAIYHVGRFKSANGDVRDAVAVNAGMGKASASTLGTNALRSFPNIRYIVMVGIAGGCPNSTDLETHVRLGDVVASASEMGVLEYDFIKRSGSDEIRRCPQRVCASLSAAMGDLVTQSILGKHPWEDRIQAIISKLGADYERPDDATDILHEGEKLIAHPVDSKRRSGEPRIFQGVIGSADILQKSERQRDELRDTFKVRAIEMEASGLQTAAWAQGKDIYVVRGICDYCDTHKNDIWQGYASAAAAGVTRELIEAMPTEWFR